MGTFLGTLPHVTAGSQALDGALWPDSQLCDSAEGPTTSSSIRQNARVRRSHYCWGSSPRPEAQCCGLEPVCPAFSTLQCLHACLQSLARSPLPFCLLQLCAPTESLCATVSPPARDLRGLEMATTKRVGLMSPCKRAHSVVEKRHLCHNATLSPSFGWTVAQDNTALTAHVCLRSMRILQNSRLVFYEISTSLLSLICFSLYLQHIQRSSNEREITANATGRQRCKKYLILVEKR